MNIYSLAQVTAKIELDKGQIQKTKAEKYKRPEEAGAPESLVKLKPFLPSRIYLIKQA